MKFLNYSMYVIKVNDFVVYNDTVNEQLLNNRIKSNSSDLNDDGDDIKWYWFPQHFLFLAGSVNLESWDEENKTGNQSCQSGEHDSIGWVHLRQNNKAEDGETSHMTWLHHQDEAHIFEGWQLVELEQTFPQTPQQSKNLRYTEGESYRPDPGNSLSNSLEMFKYYVTQNSLLR